MLSRVSLPFRSAGLVSLGLVLLCVSSLGADCTPRERKHYGWPPDAVVSYDVSRLPKNVRQQARDAFETWTRANRRNGSGVRFVEGKGSLHIQVRKGAVWRGAAQTEFRVGRDGFTIDRATIKVDLGDRAFDQHAPGYDTVVRKVVLHEVGHTMGLADFKGSPCSRPPGRSVMNGLCGTNDSRNAQPLDVTSCDAETIGAISKRLFRDRSLSPSALDLR